MMKKIDTYGIKMTGLKDACSLTHIEGGWTEITYSTISGRVMAEHHSYIPHYIDDIPHTENDVFIVMAAFKPVTMQEIANAVADLAAEHQRYIDNGRKPF